MRILVVCAAGASSTFVAQRVQRAAHTAGLDYVAIAIPHPQLDERWDDADLVLIGPHLTDQLDRIQQDAVTHGVRSIALPGDVFSDLDGSRTLRLVTEATSSPPPHGISERQNNGS